LIAVDLHAYWFVTVVKLLSVFVVIPLGSLVFVYVFLFKMMSHMQSRLGPMEAGPHGTLQPVVEAIKFLQKEDVFPARADRVVFGLAPAVVIVSTFLLYVVIPAGPRLVAQDLDTGVFFALAVSSLSVIGILMAGWASASKYSLIGGLRAAGQLIAYELPLVLAVVGVVVQAGTLRLQGIVRAQAAFTLSLGSVHIHHIPYIVTQFPGFVIFLIAAQAELTQAPFDMPIAESELVAGYMTEYTGFRFLFFFIGEFATAFAFAALASTLYLGGWYVPGVHGVMADVVGPIALGAKIMLIGFLIFWFRFTYPRLREDQLQRFAWKGLIPASLLWILITGIFKVVF
jgi:NADH-quinone oxidoreductase subunit H